MLRYFFCDGYDLWNQHVPSGRDQRYHYDIDFFQVGTCVNSIKRIPTPYRDSKKADNYVAQIEKNLNSIIKGESHFTLMYDDTGVIAIGHSSAINDPENASWLPLNGRIHPKLSPVKFQDLKFKD